MGNTILKFIHNLSLNVVLGACICSYSIGRLMSVEIPLSAVVCLAMSVWIIYTFDHLMDVYSLSKSASMDRHVFHQVNFRNLTFLIFIIFLILIFFAIQLPLKLLISGVLLGIFMVVYFLTVRLISQKVAFYKEFLIAMGFCTGIFLGAVSIYEGDFPSGLSLIFIQYFCIAFLNVLIISLHDLKHDLEDNLVSSSSRFGASLTRKTIHVFFMILGFLFLAGVLNYGHDHFLVYQGILIAMALTLFIIYKAGHRFPDYSHAMADAIFLYPAFFFFF